MLFFFLLRPQKMRVNPLNNLWRRYLCLPCQRVVERYSLKSGMLSECFFTAMVVLSDQQIVTSLALLIVGLKMLAQHRIAVYHVTVIIDMVWLSSGTHLSTLMVVSQRLTRTGRYHHSSIATAFRIILMLAICIMLMFLVWLQGYSNWYDDFARLAHCIPRDPASWGGENEFWTIVGLFLLVLGYTIEIGALITRTRVRGKTTTTSSTRNTARKALSWIWYLLRAEPANIVYSILWLSLGLMWTVNDRKRGQDAMTKQEWTLEGQLGFGQLAAMLLPVLAVVAFFESYRNKSSQHGDDVHSDGTELTQ